MKCKDHLNNEYRSLKAMCRHYGINIRSYYSRLNYDWNLEKTLTTPGRRRRKHVVEPLDHLGNEYRSVNEMCHHYGISQILFKQRLKHGWDLAMALTLKPKEMFKSKDHLEKEYRTLTEMAEAWGLSLATLSARLQNGWDLKKALTKGVGNNES